MTGRFLPLVLQDERWAEVPSHVLLIMMDALFLFALRGLPNERVMLTKADVAAWRGMGDLCRPYIEGTWEPEYPPDEVDSAFEEVQAFVDAEYASSAAPVVVYYREVIVVQHNGH